MLDLLLSMSMSLIIGSVVVLVVEVVCVAVVLSYVLAELSGAFTPDPVTGEEAPSVGSGGGLDNNVIERQ